MTEHAYTYIPESTCLLTASLYILTTLSTPAFPTPNSGNHKSDPFSMSLVYYTYFINVGKLSERDSFVVGLKHIRLEFFIYSSQKDIPKAKEIVCSNM